MNKTLEFYHYPIINHYEFGPRGYRIKFKNKSEISGFNFKSKYVKGFLWTLLEYMKNTFFTLKIQFM